MTSQPGRMAVTTPVSVPFRLPPAAAGLDLLVIAIATAIAVAISRAPLGSGDYGQWLMVSRMYTGEDVPSYRELGGIAPLVPVLLGLIRVFVDDPVVALNVLRVVLLTWLIFAFYLAGSALFRSRSAGLMAAVLLLFMTYEFLELFAFGGVLQAASIVFLVLAIAAVSQTRNGEREESFWWMTTAGCTALALLSHVGSAVVIVPSIAAAAVVMLGAGGLARWREWPRKLAPAAGVAAIPAAYWLIFLAPANRSYSTNPASLAYRGPDRLFEPLTEPGLTLALVVAGATALGIGAGRCIARRRVDGYGVVAAWTVATWVVMVVTVAGGAATDYPRFIPLLLAPAVLAAGGGIAELGQAVQKRVLPTDFRWISPAVVLAAVLLAVLGPRQIDTFHSRANGYALGDQASVRRIAAWIDENLPEGQSVLTSSNREGKWIEGLSGEEALFAGPIRYSFRSSEWTRSLAATSVIRSTTALVNGSWLAMFTSSAEGQREFVPTELLVAMNHDGEYLDLARLPDNEAYAVADGQVLARLANLEPLSVERIEADDRVIVRTMWSGARPGGNVEWVREVSLYRADGALAVTDRVTADVPVDEILLHVRPAGNFPLTSITEHGDGVEMRYTRAGRRQPRLDIASPSGALVFDGGEQVIARSSGPTMELRLTALTAGDAIAEPAILYPPQVLEDYGVGAAVLTRGPAAAARIERLRALGFSREIEAGAYILLIRENAVGRLPEPSVNEEVPHERR